MVSIRRASALVRDFSISAVIAGFVSVLVGYSSAAVIVFQAAQALGATEAEIASWMWALGLGLGLTTILLSLRYRAPVVMAWSTPGAAMLITSAANVSLAEGIGAFLFSAVLITLCGLSGWFERAMSRIPLSMASALLAGVLLRFGLNVFVAMETQFGMVFAMFCAYLIAYRWLPRYAVLIALTLGVAIAAMQEDLQMAAFKLEMATPILTRPQFSLSAIVGIALPLFAVTMASQNVPGVAVLRAAGYERVPISPLISWTGIATVLLAPLGAFAMNLAAITAAICMGPDAHKDPDKRYVAAVAAGVFYILLGIFGATIGALFTALPQELVMAIAGLALLNTIGKGLAVALVEETERGAALITFLVTASGITLWGIGSAFWGLVVGALVMSVMRIKPLKIVS
ncbi:benzoate/H(+) symporter BenE family transporter [Nodosilinea sp. LEGE 07088]|uniref:benzoate/H(+) symporter BenE family transporter n=1 Tax=Nodosilinea sp. LEGE 07088 TaxID=2777968 RepID=UPI00188084D0|nr:benzoate/H(+) symporter BenE family transporter [Nodosilinea sp. LEGE 07088]MBE9137812.1 benzoate/H(+) symporter BenE family transporter [Nodosilinea sp. LEGE 07088]